MKVYICIYNLATRPRWHPGLDFDYDFVTRLCTNHKYLHFCYIYVLKNCKNNGSLS